MVPTCSGTGACRRHCSVGAIGRVMRSSRSCVVLNSFVAVEAAHFTVDHGELAFVPERTSGISTHCIRALQLSRLCALLFPAECKLGVSYIVTVPIVLAVISRLRLLENSRCDGTPNFFPSFRENRPPNPRAQRRDGR